MKDWKLKLQKSITVKDHFKARGNVIIEACAALNIKPKRIAEIGVYKGTTSKKLVSAFPESEIYLIDPWITNDSSKGRLYKMYKEQSYWDDIYHKVCLKFGNKCNIIRSKNEDCVNVFNDNFFNVIFIDGIHTYSQVYNEIKNWMPKVKTGGLFTGHDYNGEVKKAVDDLIGEGNIYKGVDSVFINYKQ